MVHKFIVSRTPYLCLIYTCLLLFPSMSKKNEINTDELLVKLSEMIKNKRNYLGLTVAELSKKSKVSVGVISDIENIRGRVPSLVNFLKITYALEISKEEFMELLPPDNSAPCSNTESIRLILKDYGLYEENIMHIIAQIEAFKCWQVSADYNQHSYSFHPYRYGYSHSKFPRCNDFTQH